MFKNTLPKIGEINGDSANQFPVERRNLCGQKTENTRACEGLKGRVISMQTLR